MKEECQQTTGECSIPTVTLGVLEPLSIAVVTLILDIDDLVRIIFLFVLTSCDITFRFHIKIKFKNTLSSVGIIKKLD